MSNRGNIFDLKYLRTSCMQCRVRELCLPAGLSESEIRELDQVIERRQVLKPGEQVFHQGQAFRHLSVVRTGTIKTYVMDVNGVERVTGFLLPGELLGLDAITRGHHASTAQALESSSVCDIPFDSLERLARIIPRLQYHLLRHMSRKIHHDEQTMLLLGMATAKRRLYTFLFGVSFRYREHGLSPNHFRLSMTRCDIANYLGLAVETVSRLMTSLQREGVVTVVGREVIIDDMAALRALVFNERPSLPMRKT
jgi:CRP/FNR family transcriptional regulator